MVTTGIKRFVGVLAVLAVGSSVRAGELADLYKKGAETAVPARENTPGRIGPRDERQGVAEIGLERTPCLGACPAYTVIIKGDGTVRYTGTAFARLKGSHTGRIDPEQFSWLARFILEEGYMDLKDSYILPATDLPGTYTSVVMGGKRKVILNYGNQGPARLWAVEQLIDKLVSEARWDDGKPTEK